MTDLQKRFCEEYVIDSHITNAGKRAGIQGDNINVTAWKMLQLPAVQEYIEQLQADAALRCQITKDQWLEEWKKLGFSKITDYMEDDLAPKALSTVNNPEAIKSIKKTVTEGEFGTKTQVEFSLHDKPTALINIGKHLGFYETDNKQTQPIISIPAPVVYNTAPPLASTENEVDE